MYRSPSRRAVVDRLAASDPTPGSVSPKVASFSPRACGHEVLLLLLLAPPLQQGQRVEAGVDAEDDAERGVRSLHLLAQQGEGDVVHPRAAVLLRDRQTQEARGSHLLVEGAVVGRGAVELTDAREDLPLREGARRALHLSLGIGQ